MSDVRDWGAFIRGRWDWTRNGYEKGFPRGSQFTDIDAVVEFDGRRLVIEAKHWDGEGMIPSIHSDEPRSQMGQRLALRAEAKSGAIVFVIYGCGACNDPWAMHELAPQKAGDRFIDWRGEQTKEARRKLFKQEIDRALGMDARQAA